MVVAKLCYQSVRYDWPVQKHVRIKDDVRIRQFVRENCGYDLCMIRSVRRVNHYPLCCTIIGPQIVPNPTSGIVGSKYYSKLRIYNNVTEKSTTLPSSGTYCIHIVVVFRSTPSEHVCFGDNHIDEAMWGESHRIIPPVRLRLSLPNQRKTMHPPAGQKINN